MAENKQAPPSTKMSAIPPSPLKILREDSVDGTLSPVSSKSTGTDTDTDTRKKVMMMTFVSLICVHWIFYYAVLVFCIHIFHVLMMVSFIVVVTEVPHRPGLFYSQGNSHDRTHLQKGPGNT